MAEKSKRNTGSEATATPGAGTEATSGARGDKDDFVWVRKDGAICFGSECVTIAPTETGRLGMVIRPDQCGAAIGSVLIAYLTRTAGKGVVIEIPSEFEKESLAARELGIKVKDQESHK